MASTFFGLGVAYSGLSANQMALNTVSHNIANANTPGFARQRLTMQANQPDTFPSVPGTIGKGVGMDNVQQIRDEFLDEKYRGENTKLGEYSSLSSVYSTLEAIFNEPSDSGITTVMDEFFSALHELNKAPESLTTRALVRQRAIALQEAIGGLSESLEREQKNLDFEIEVVSTQINGYAKQIADLNKTIYNTELNGQTANDLRDQRNLVLDKLSELVDINYYEDSMGRFYVDVTGRSLVSHYDYDQLKLVERTSRDNPYDIDRLNDLEWESGSTFTTTGGKLKALIDMRDNIDGEQKGIPYYVDKLNEFTDTLITEMNRVHKSGYDLNAETGTNLFTINNMTTAEFEDYLLTSGFNGQAGIDVTTAVLEDTAGMTDQEEIEEKIHDNITDILENNPAYDGKSIKFVQGKYIVVDRIEAKELTISKDIESDLDKIAASATAEGAPGDGGNALTLAEVRHNTGLYAWGSPDDFLKSLISNLGVDAQDASRNEDNETVLLKQIEFNRQSIMGVSLDEEMTNMIKFQQAYNASARMVNVIDEMIDLVVNRLGTVGR
ncbi:flagellar hook-associated protein FlgK [Acidaminobacter sp. JC074]|uniref:flagellar hook-associated protein FlgK n=1 Tax=Acidaminobacter sp. JC074 TaxID=2530199 RepID=UPI001F0E923A|nr:flagellar hook-associated protein FlgK [Acidaminobacter sp. JC074]MCH4889300.1 flagellar hook-associated protein FlgK [Acidaminobacter sp. JC074]